MGHWVTNRDTDIDSLPNFDIDSLPNFDIDFSAKFWDIGIFEI